MSDETQIKEIDTDDVQGWVPVELGIPRCYGEDSSEIVWLRMKDDWPGKEDKFVFVLGRLEWETKGTDTYPDAERGVENPACVMKWERGNFYFTDIHLKRRVAATHWHSCTLPSYPGANIVFIEKMEASR